MCTSVRLLNHLVRSQHQRRRDREPQRLGGFRVDDQLELGGLLDGEIVRLGTLENPVHVGRKPTEDRLLVRPVTHQATRFHVAPVREGRWQPVPGCQAPRSWLDEPRTYYSL